MLLNLPKVTQQLSGGAGSPTRKAGIKDRAIDHQLHSILQSFNVHNPFL